MRKDVQPKTEKDHSAYYQLHTGAIEDLVNASAENTPKYSEEELNKYRSGKTKWKMPEALKVVLIKFWFYGAICYFVFFGLSMYLADQLDLYFVAAIIMGMATDLLIKHFLRFTEKLPGGSNRWMMVTKNGATGFFMNLMYAFLLLVLVALLYTFTNGTLHALLGQKAPVLRVEPLLFGAFCVAMDHLCIFFKHMLQSMVQDAKNARK